MSKFKIGDLITAYNKGFHEVVEIRKRWENRHGTTDYERLGQCIWDTYDPATCGDPMNDLIGYKVRYKADGTPLTGKAVRYCDESFCLPMDVALDLRVKEMETTLKRLKDLI